MFISGLYRNLFRILCNIPIVVGIINGVHILYFMVYTWFVVFGIYIGTKVFFGVGGWRECV